MGYMQSNFSKMLLLFGVVISFIPLLVANSLLNSYLHRHVSEKFHASSEAVLYQNQLAVSSSVTSLEKVLKNSPSLCTTTFQKNVQNQLQVNENLIQIVVENKDGVQYCNGHAGVIKYSFLSEILPIPNQLETISIVQLENHDRASYKITKAIGSNRTISAFVYVKTDLTGLIPNYLLDDISLKLKLTNDITVFSNGVAYSDEVMSDSSAMIVTNAVAQSLPISTQLALPYSKVSSSFLWIFILLTVLFALIGGLILLLVFKFLRQADLPAIDLERAVAQGEFVPYYQPLVNIKTGKLVGCEALMRWKKRNGEVIAPGMFIDYAESSGIAFPMTIGLMKKVVTDLEALCIKQPDLKIGINLFEGHFRDTTIVDDVRAIFEHSDINYSQLVFEITERRPLKNQLAVDGVIGGLQALGCKIAMDDAGTGHSNLAYMQTLNVDIIKIDKVFVDMIREGVSNVPILDGLIAIAQDLGAGIVAEGVEEQEQIDYLREHGVYEVQGFLFSPAIKPEDFIELANKMNMPATQKKTAPLSIVKAA